MNVFIVRVALIMLVGVFVGGTTYVVLTIIELLKKK